MLTSRRPSSNSGEDDESQTQLRHYPSTPHLETFRVVSRSASTANPVNTYMPGGSQLTGKPVLSTFSTFSHHKSGTDLRYRDDPNPYKVSDIEEFRIQVHDPYRTRSTIQLSKPCSSRSSRGSGNYYGGEEDVFEDDGVDLKLPSNRTGSAAKFENKGKFYPRSNSSNNSGGYEVPDPDYGGSTGGSSEDLPLPPVLPPASDTSEEYSHSLSMSASSGSGGPSPSPIHEEPDSPIPLTPTKISDEDRNKIEFALRGRKTEIYVADSLANLYYRGKNPTRPNSVGSAVTSSSSHSASPVENVEWILRHTGVPVLLLDTGETKSRDKRRIQIVLAELGSGLALWKDLVDNLTSYHVVGTETGSAGRVISTFHTMHMSKDHTKVVGLSFDNADTADRFARQVDKLTSDFANISLSGSKYKNKKEAKNKEKTKMAPKWIKPKKSDISQPCGFLHVSSLSPKDKNLFSSLQHFVRSPGTNNNNTTTTEVSH